MPLLKDGRMQSAELQLPVSATLPAGYLCQDSKKVEQQQTFSLLNVVLWTNECTKFCLLGFVGADSAGYQVGRKCKDAVQSEDACSIDHLSSGTPSLHAQSTVGAVAESAGMFEVFFGLLRTPICRSSSSTAS